MVPILFGTWDWFHRRQYFRGLGGWGEWRRGDCWRMIQVRYIYCALHFCYYYISSTSDHQALDSKGWGPPNLKNPEFVSILAKGSVRCLAFAVAESTQVWRALVCI